VCDRHPSIDAVWDELVAQVNDEIGVGQLRSCQSPKYKRSMRMIFSCITQLSEHVPGKATPVGFKVRPL